ncbi:MAG: hypothetical protein L0229_24610 [Blastocatellia bacterium]|nr:hypothetical protein [Blastocatellia bacterium]
MISRTSNRTILIRVIASVVVLLIVFIAADLLLPASKAKQYQHDKQGRLVRRTTPNGRIIKYDYDKASLLTEISYHQMGAITKWAYPAGSSVRFKYDPSGNLISMKDRLGETRYNYDEHNRLAEIINPAGKKVSYEYDPWEQIRRITLPDEYSLKYHYNVLGNITSVNDGQGAIYYEYSGDTNRVYRRLPNGITTAYESSPSGELASIQHLKADGTSICAYKYEYDPEGRVSAIEETSPHGREITRYEYDLMGRLNKVSQPDGRAITYEYDAMGNRAAETDGENTIRYVYDSQGRLIKAGEMTCAYDAAGNLVSKADKSKRYSYEYDDENRLIKVRAGKNTIEYAYDGEGNRVRRELNGKVTNYINDPVKGMPQVAGEYGRDGKVSHYLLGQNRVGRRNANGEAIYFLEDHLGSTRCVVDAKGDVIARYAYSPFGMPRLVEGKHQTEFLYTGEQWDDEAQLLYLRARYYDPQTGRFLSVDPIPGSPLAPETFNQYAYVNNDPVNQTDPLGLQGWPPPPYYNPNRDRWNYPPSIPDWPDGRRFPFPFPFPKWPNEPRYPNPGYPRRAAGGAETNTRHEPLLDNLLNRFGRITGSYWIGRNRSGNWDSYEQDRLGAFPLGDTTLRGRFWLDELARRHDIQYYISTHTRKGTEVAVQGPHGTEYYTSEGSAGGANWRVTRDVLLGSLPGPSGKAFRYYQEHFGVRRTPRTRNAYSLDEVRSFYEDSRNKGLFPPDGGGGGGGIPSVGGVYLDQTAKVIGELGAITGAMYDKESGRIILVGDKNTDLPPMKPEYLAAAIRAVYSQSPQAPGMTIDPNPQNPYGPVMDVTFFGNTENTRLGWVMFEADRVMKGYSIGNDNITKQPMQSSVPGYQSVTAMGLRDGINNPNLWSRFWLVPEPVTARVSDGERSIIFDPIKICVKTETMRLIGGKLVPAGDIKDRNQALDLPCQEWRKIVAASGIRDPHAEAFAEHFTDQYEDFA